MLMAFMGPPPTAGFDPPKRPAPRSTPRSYTPSWQTNRGTLSERSLFFSALLGVITIIAVVTVVARTFSTAANISRGYG